jgi:Right handed beta helix region
MPQANDLATWIVEPTNKDAGTSGYEARKRYSDTETITHYSSAATMFQDIADDLGTAPRIGGLVYVKNGIYVIDTTEGAEAIIQWSNATDGPNTEIDMVGETRDGAIIRNAVNATDDNVFKLYPNMRLENLTFDGNGVGTEVSLVKAVSASDVDIMVNNCRFTKMTWFGLQTYYNRNVSITNCIFEESNSTKDQCAYSAANWAVVANNVFDRTVGENAGSSLTTGYTRNTHVHNNVINRPDPAGDGDNLVHGISVESFSENPDYENIRINNNIVVNGTISLGGVGAYTQKFRNINIESNILYGGDIRVRGPDTGDHSTQMMDVSIDNNKIYNPFERGIWLEYTAGLCFIRNNTVKNSNISLNATDYDKGCIYMVFCEKAVCERNSMYMTVTSPADAHFSPYGIKYISVTNSMIRNNRIINTTAGNPSYSASGTNTGTRVSETV